MMNFEKFVEWVTEDLQRLLGEDFRIESTSVRKNNGINLKALTVQHIGSHVTPVIYMEPLYSAYKNGSSIDRITKKVLANLEKELPFSSVFTEASRSFDTARDHIAFRLVSKVKNEELLKNIPWKSWEDLAIIYYLHFDVMDNKQISSIIHNYQMEKWNISLDELHELAKENTPKLCPSTIGRLDHLIFGWDEDKDDMIACDSELPTLYILSNLAGINGAVCMLYDNVVKEFADMIDSDLLILPSSIHEVLVLKYDEDVNLEVFKDMVRKVNEEDVPVEDVLSDSVYLYTRENDQIKIV